MFCTTLEIRVMRLSWPLAFAWLVVLLECRPSMGSVGAIFAKRHTDGSVYVREVPPDSHAVRGGLQPGDEVLLIDGQDVRHMTAEQVHDAFVGPVGTTVDLTIARGDEVVRLRVQRGSLK